MDFSKFFLLFFFFFYYYTLKPSSAEDCLPIPVGCARWAPLIQFPFSVEYFGRCAYPGFNMSCYNERNSIVIQIGSWGEFFVNHVNYRAQKVQIYDQHNCLPKRLLKMDLSDSPFRGAYYRNFTFYNCSSDFSSNISKPISCLSTRNHSVYASSNDSSKKNFSVCDVISSVLVPSEASYKNDEIINDLHLVWDIPDCRECLKNFDTKCGFKNTESRELKCFFYTKHTKGTSTFRTIIVAIGISIPVVLIVAMFTCCITRKYGRSPDVSNTGRNVTVPTIMLQPVFSRVGLDESIIQSYPKTVLGESPRLNNPEDNTCSICLSEYEAKETLKTIPDCKHRFHATCIDEWLRKNVTCPFCRHAPTPSHLSS